MRYITTNGYIPYNIKALNMEYGGLIIQSIVSTYTSIVSTFADRNYCIYVSLLTVKV